MRASANVGWEQVLAAFNTLEKEKLRGLAGCSLRDGRYVRKTIEFMCLDEVVITQGRIGNGQGAFCQRGLSHLETMLPKKTAFAGGNSAFCQQRLLEADRGDSSVVGDVVGPASDPI